MNKILAVLFLLLPTAALAQQQNDPPIVQVLAKRLNMEYSANLQCNVALVTVQEELKALKEKYEPAKKEEGK